MSRNAKDKIAALKYGWLIYPDSLATPLTFGSYLYVDSDNGNDTDNSGETMGKAKKTIQAAVTAASSWDVIYVRPKAMATGATDPANYTENIVIPADKEGLQIIGVGTGRVQGGLPQLKVGSTTTQALLTVRAPAFAVRGMGINGAGATGGGILLDDDGSTKTAFGFSIENCHFKNCVGTTATNAATGGAIQWAAGGGAFQGFIGNNRFYKNVGDIVAPVSMATIPQDIIIQDNVFSGPAASVDCNIYVGTGGINGIEIDNNKFPCNPNIGSGTNASFLVLTDCVGMLADNKFAAQTAEGVTTEIKFGAAQENLVPTTVFMANNYGEFPTGTGAGLVSGEIFRT